MTILDELAATAVERTEKAKKSVSLEKIKKKALSMPRDNFPFEKSRDFPLSASAKRLHPQRELSPRTFHIFKSQRNTKKQVPTASLFSPSRAGF